VDEPREEDPEERQHQGQQQRSDQDQLAHRVAKIHGPSQAVALWDKRIRIVGIVVQEVSIPVPIIIAENGTSALTISGCASFCPGTLSRQEQDEDESNQESTDQQEKELRVHRCSSFKRGAMVRVKRFTMGNASLRPFPNYYGVPLVSIVILVRPELRVTFESRL